MRILIGAAMAGIAVPAVLVSVAAIAQAQATAGLSVETTDLGTLLDNPAAKAVLAKHIPTLVANEQISMARALTLKQLQAYAGDIVTDEKLALIQADLDKLPK
jgi:hypothetical protein